MKKIFILFLFFFSFSVRAKENPNNGFIENKGQIHDHHYQPRHEVLFGNSFDNFSLFLKASGVEYQISKIEETVQFKGIRDIKITSPSQISFYRIDLNWLNCNVNCQPKGNYSDSAHLIYYNQLESKGSLDVRRSSEVLYKNLYNGIDLKWYIKNGKMKYDFLVAAGKDHRQIEIEVKGATKIRLNNSGDMIISTPFGDIIEQAPLVYQLNKRLKSKWKIINNHVQFEIENVDNSLPIVIDPAIRLWGTYFGRSAEDVTFYNNIDQAGNLYLTGHTSSTSNIATVGSHQTTFGGNGGSFGDAFLAKYNAGGVLQWCTYYGGGGNDFGCSVLRFVRYSDFISKKHPYIKFDEDRIEYLQIAKEQPLAQYFWKLRESKDRNAYLISFSNQDIALYDSELNILRKYESSKLCENDYNLRTVELTNDLSLFCFTCVNKAYILNKNFNIIAAFQVPHKDEYEKRMRNGGATSLVEKRLALLDLKYPSSHEEVKASFRKLIYKYHPDRNPDSKEAEEKAKELIGAYEYLSGQDISSVMDNNNPDEYYWVNKKYSFLNEIDDFRIEFTLDHDRPEDWIYGAGFSSDNSMIYLGCFSGKVYETNLDGSVNKIYIIPKDEKSDGPGSTNPISFVYDTENIKYILSLYYLYVIENDVVVNHIVRNISQIRWFGEFIIKQLDKEIILYDQRGNLLGNILFKTPIRHVCYNGGLLLIELTTKTMTFKIKAKV